METLKPKRRAKLTSVLGTILALLAAVGVWTLAAIVAVRDACGEPGLLEEARATRPIAEPSRAAPPATATPPPPLSAEPSVSSPPALARPSPRRANAHAALTASPAPGRSATSERFMDER